MISQQENFPNPASPQIGGLKKELAGENDEDPFGNTACPQTAIDIVSTKRAVNS